MVNSPKTELTPGRRAVLVKDNDSAREKAVFAKAGPAVDLHEDNAAAEVKMAPIADPVKDAPAKEAKVSEASRRNEVTLVTKTPRDGSIMSYFAPKKH